MEVIMKMLNKVLLGFILLLSFASQAAIDNDPDLQRAIQASLNDQYNAGYDDDLAIAMALSLSEEQSKLDSAVVAHDDYVFIHEALPAPTNHAVWKDVDNWHEVDQHDQHSVPFLPVAPKHEDWRTKFSDDLGLDEETAVGIAMLESQPNSKTPSSAADPINDVTEKSKSDVLPMKIWNKLAGGVKIEWLGAQIEMVRFCDTAYKNKAKPFENGKIKQIPVLFQGYPCLRKDLCGYYAAYFAWIMLPMFSTNTDAAINLLSDRRMFEAVVSRWEIANNKKITLNIENSAIKVELLRDRPNAFVEGHDFDLLGKQDNQKLAKIVSEFLSGDDNKKMCFILNTSDSAKGSHWITVLVDKKEKQFVIADSLATDRTKLEKVVNLYKYIFDN